MLSKGITVKGTYEGYELRFKSTKSQEVEILDVMEWNTWEELLKIKSNLKSFGTSINSLLFQKKN